MAHARHCLIVGRLTVDHDDSYSVSELPSIRKKGVWLKLAKIWFIWIVPDRDSLWRSLGCANQGQGKQKDCKVLPKYFGGFLCWEWGHFNTDPVFLHAGTFRKSLLTTLASEDRLPSPAVLHSLYSLALYITIHIPYSTEFPASLH